MVVVMAPWDPVVLRSEGILGAVGKVVENGLIEFAPDGASVSHLSLWAKPNRAWDRTETVPNRR